ncbi:MFS transporter [Streptosporangium sp. OZ121]|uniref:MFS transporter n=1 Tax=Streptosporangium sp. OZ121 TaxID=3444183 RepID=UPI003F79B292
MHDEAASTAVMERMGPTPDKGWGRWASVATLGIGTFAIGTDIYVGAGVLGAIAGDFKITVGVAGLTVTVFALTYAIGTVLLTALLGARSLRPVLIGSLVLFGLFNLISAVAPTFPVLLAGQAMSALAAAVYLPAAGATAVAAVSPSHRGRALGLLLGGSSIAMVLGAPLGVLLSAMFSWRAAFGLVAVFATVTLIGVSLSGIGSGVIGSKVWEGSRLIPSRAVAGALGVSFLVLAASSGTYTYLPLLLEDTVGPAELGLFIGVFGLGGLVGTWCGGVAADRYGSRRMVPLSVATLIMTFVVLPLVATTVAGIVAVMFVWGVAVWGFVPAQQHRLIGLRSASVSYVLALNSSANNFGFAAGALFGGLLIDAAGIGSLWMLTAACCGAGLVLHGLLSQEVRP